jgi:hypothetical protein
MKTEFSTSDLVIAAYLLTAGHPIDRIIKDGNKGTFVFKGVDPALITIFDLGSARIEPQAFHNNVRHLSNAVRRM